MEELNNERGALPCSEWHKVRFFRLQIGNNLFPIISTLLKILLVIEE